MKPPLPLAHASDPSSPTDSGRRQLLKLSSAAVAMGSMAIGKTATAAARTGDVLDVAIVGAGLAGLTAARDLQTAGLSSFVVLEARKRVGGRTLNHDVGGGHISEVGGQWIGPGQTAVADLARELDVDTFPTYYEGKTTILGGKGRVAMDLQGTFGTDKAIAEKLSELSKQVPSGEPWKAPNAKELDKMSVGDWLVKQNIKPEDRISWDGSIALSGGVMPAKMGLLHFLSMINSANKDYEQLDSIKHSAQETRFVGGSQILSIKMAQKLGSQLKLACPVRKISNWDKGDVITLHTDQGEIRARKAILAIHPALCNRIEFDPPLPEKRQALQRAWPAHSPARKTAMVYKKPFWREKGLNGHIFQANGPVIWAWDNSPPQGEIGVINAFVVNGKLPSDSGAAKRILADIYAQALGPEALTPVSFHEHDWLRSDPWSLTCVSAIPPGFWTTHGEGWRQPCGNLIWSGTETADIWAGYMDGAVRSGHQAALRVLNHIRQTKSTT